MNERITTELERFLVTTEDTLADALVRLRDNGIGVAAVAEEGGAVAGTITDADVRRAMLRDDHDVQVAEVMSSHPVIAGPDASDAELRDLMLLHRVRAVPIVDAKRLVGMRSLEEVVRDLILPTTVIMAGGEGRRLRPLTEDVPKPLIKVGDKTILERVIEPLARTGITEITLALNYKADAIVQHLGDGSEIGVHLEYLVEPTRMGTAGALALLPDRSDRPICVANADIVTTLDFARLFDYHWHHRAAITVAAVGYTASIPYGVLRTAGHYLVTVDEKPQQRSLVSGGIYLLDPEVLRFIRGRAPLDMPDLVGDVLAEGLPVCVFPVLEKWFDVGQLADLERARADLATEGREHEPGEEKGIDR